VAAAIKEAAPPPPLGPPALPMEDAEEEGAPEEDGDEARSEATFSFKAQSHEIYCNGRFRPY